MRWSLLAALCALSGCGLLLDPEPPPPGGATDASTAPDPAGCESTPEECDGIDNDCDGTVDERNAVSGPLCDLAFATASCVAGVCRIGTCRSGYGDCDVDEETGCETDLRTESDCGACGVDCGGDICTAVPGGFACSTVCPFTMCPDGCRDLSADVMNCGMCGRTCTIGQACVAGGCRDPMCTSYLEFSCAIDGMGGCSSTCGSLRLTCNDVQCVCTNTVTMASRTCPAAFPGGAVNCDLCEASYLAGCCSP